MKIIMLLFGLMAFMIIAIFIYKFQKNSIDLICPGTVYFKIIFNQPEDTMIYDFSAYEELGIIQIIERSKENIVSYWMKYGDDERMALIEELSEYYGDDLNGFAAAVDEKFSGIYNPLIYFNQIVVKYKNGNFKWILG